MAAVAGRSTGSLGGIRRLATIFTAPEIEQLRSIAANYAVPVENIIVVPSVQEWSRAHGIPENNTHRTACVVQNQQSGQFLVVLAAEITDSMQSSVLTAMELRGFVDEVELLRTPRRFLQHLLLHELAHPLHPGGTESECDTWAFNELERYAA